MLFRIAVRIPRSTSHSSSLLRGYPTRTRVTCPSAFTVNEVVPAEIVVKLPLFGRYEVTGLLLPRVTVTGTGVTLTRAVPFQSGAARQMARSMEPFFRAIGTTFTSVPEVVYEYG